MSDCIFCKIVEGDIPSYKIYEDEEFIAMLDRFPSELGHVLVLPKKHVENIYEVDEATAAKLFAVASQLAKKIHTALDCDGMNLLQNNGETAGQSVFHLHLHIIPRYKNDDVKVSWKTKDPSNEKFLEMLKKLG